MLKADRVGLRGELDRAILLHRLAADQGEDKTQQAHASSEPEPLSVAVKIPGHMMGLREEVMPTPSKIPRRGALEEGHCSGGY